MEGRHDHSVLQDAESTYTKAAKAELDRSFDAAFKLYIRAAEQYLHLSRTSSDAFLRIKCKNEAGKALGRAEKIKGAKSDLTPITKDITSEQEQFLVLKQSSSVNGVVYPLWTEPVQPTKFNSIHVVQPSLSEEQKNALVRWEKPAKHAMGQRSSIVDLLPQDVVQHVVSDCSVCASISVCIDHDARFQSKLVKSALYPQDDERNPVYDQSGTHYVRFLFNGGYRRIDIDDQLPTSPDGTLMCVSTGSKGQLWPSLVEKAYMKLMGGYEFPGSLSSTDLHTLIGWIPEYIETSSRYFEIERTWEKLLQGFSDGRCLITLGTGEKIQHPELSPIALLPSHCYAVIDILESKEGRSITIIDSWTGRSQTTSVRISEHENQRPQSCHLPWDIICNVFNGIFLSWDPNMFPNTSMFHGIWTKRDNMNATFARHIKLELRAEIGSSNTTSDDIWVLLTRHITDTKRHSEFISLSVSDDSSSDLNELLLKGEFTNNTHVLVKIRLNYTRPILSIIAAYDGEYDDVGFTLSAYAFTPLSWAQETRRLPYTKTVSGSITSKNAGGNLSLPTFMVNPQYHVRIDPDPTVTGSVRGSRAHFELSLQADRHLPLNMTMLWSRGERVAEVAKSDVVVSSGAYSYGFTSMQKDLLAGDYTLIVSAFDTKDLGSFSLEALCDRRFSIEPIPQEGAGMFSKIIRGAWTSETAAGGPSSHNYTLNPVFMLKFTARTEVKIRLQLVNPTHSAALNVTLFNLTAQHKLGTHVMTSGPYSDALCGVVTEQIALEPGSYAIIPSTYRQGIEGHFKMVVYMTKSGATVSEIKLGK